MWAVVVEVGAPCRHQIAGIAQAVEQMFIQVFMPHSSVEAFDEAVLYRLVPLHGSACLHEREWGAIYCQSTFGLLAISGSHYQSATCRCR